MSWLSSANANALGGVLEGHRQKKLTQMEKKNGDLSIKNLSH
ncbi:hypothetical protein RintRC_0837 [Richelia intracellularis]|nr:hypothetical protein RintRC_0837 [Richelia intracellularis]